MAKSLFGLFLAVFFIPTAHATSIINNGGFETGDFTGWTQSGWFIDATNPNSGVYDASTGCAGSSCTTAGDPNSAFLSQTLATTVGTTYTLSFFYNSGQLASQSSELLVLWGNPIAASLATVADFVNVDTSGTYAEYTGMVSAISATSELEFLARQDLDFYYLDDVSLTAGVTSTVSEPGSWFVVLVGFALVWVTKRNSFHLVARR